MARENLQNFLLSTLRHLHHHHQDQRRIYDDKYINVEVFLFNFLTKLLGFSSYKHVFII